MPSNFLRHYNDISQLLDRPEVTAFIGTPEYNVRKEHRFRESDNLIISKNEAFLLSDAATRERYTLAYEASASLYFGGQIPFNVILGKILNRIDEL